MEVKLIYSLKSDDTYSYYPTMNIDAVTGKYLDYLGQEVESSSDSFVKTISSDKYGYIAIARGLSIINNKSKTLNSKGTINM